MVISALCGSISSLEVTQCSSLAPELSTTASNVCSLLQILSQLEQCTKYPDFNNYLAYIFAQGDTLPIEV